MAKNPAKITPRNILAVIQAHYRKLRNKFAPSSRTLSGLALPNHIWEQIIWRRTQAKKECMAGGSCVECGCEILGKTMEDRACSNKPSCYPAMMTEGEWKKYKIFNDIKLFL